MFDQINSTDVPNLKVCGFWPLEVIIYNEVRREQFFIQKAIWVCMSVLWTSVEYRAVATRLCASFISSGIVEGLQTLWDKASKIETRSYNSDLRLRVHVHKTTKTWVNSSTEPFLSGRCQEIWIAVRVCEEREDCIPIIRASLGYYV